MVAINAITVMGYFLGQSLIISSSKFDMALLDLVDVASDWHHTRPIPHRAHSLICLHEPARSDGGVLDWTSVKNIAINGN